LFFQEEKPFEAMFSHMLLDHIEFNDKLMGARLPKQDPIFKLDLEAIYSLDAVQVNL
jgi:hypothetical protein